MECQMLLSMDVLRRNKVRIPLPSQDDNRLIIYYLIISNPQ